MGTTQGKPSVASEMLREIIKYGDSKAARLVRRKYEKSQLSRWSRGHRVPRTETILEFQRLGLIDAHLWGKPAPKRRRLSNDLT